MTKVRNWVHNGHINRILNRFKGSGRHSQETKYITTPSILSFLIMSPNRISNTVSTLINGYYILPMRAPFQLKDRSKHLLLCCIGSSFSFLDPEIRIFIPTDCLKRHVHFPDYRGVGGAFGVNNDHVFVENIQKSLRKELSAICSSFCGVRLAKILEDRIESALPFLLGQEQV